MMTYHLSLPANAPESYEDLARLYAPRKIFDKIGLQNATEVVDWLSIRAQNRDQIEFLDLVSDLLQEYESQLGNEDGPSSPLELLNFLVQENEVTTRTLGDILEIDHSTAARILKGNRSITPDHAKKLGEYFAIRPSRFLGLE